MKFLNTTKATQGLYLPSVCGRLMYTELTFVGPGGTIEVDDERNIELLRNLCGKGTFVEIDAPAIADHPSKAKIQRCANPRCRAPLDGSSESPFCSEDCRLQNIRRSIATRATRDGP